MSVTLNLRPDVEEGLIALARERGVSLSDYLEEIAAREVSRYPAQGRSTGEQRAQAFLEWAESFPDTAPLSDESISRASMYPDGL